MITGITRPSSSAVDTGVAPGRVDSPPISMIAAPAARSASALALACSGVVYRPPSEKESGVTLIMPITAVGRRDKVCPPGASRVSRGSMDVVSDRLGITMLLGC